MKPIEALKQKTLLPWNPKNRSLMRSFPNWKNRNRFLKIQQKAMTVFHMKSEG